MPKVARIVLLVLSSCYLSHEVPFADRPDDPTPVDPIPPPEEPEPPDVCEPLPAMWVRNDCPTCNAIHISVLRRCGDFVFEAARSERRSWRVDACSGALAEFRCESLDTATGCADCGPAPDTLNDLLQEHASDTPRGVEGDVYLPADEVQPLLLRFTENVAPCDELAASRAVCM